METYAEQMDGETFPEHALQYKSYRYRGTEKEILKAKYPGSTNHVPTIQEKEEKCISI
jgi:hypothetical protein